MKTRNILKLFGESDIKLKDRIIGILKLLFALTFGITAAITVFYFADEQLNGVFLDWFAEKFFYNGTNHIDGIDYHQLKTTLIIFFVSISEIAFGPG